jgi:hypothetical protein
MKNRSVLLRMTFLLFVSIGLSTVFIKAATLPVIPGAVFTITDYGAVSSTTMDNTSAIQMTINTCSAAGGGTVEIPAGTFLSGPISMKSNINLQISSGATLTMLPYGSGNGTVAGSYPNSGTTNDYTDFIYGKNLTNVEVSGSGTIEGQGAAWWTAYQANTAISRPSMIQFDGCTNIAVLGITLKNAPNVHISISKLCSNTTISGVTINTPFPSPNTDGIDTWSPNVDITNCKIADGDDNIAMDSGSDNISIKDCTFGTGHGCSVGSYASNVGNIHVDSCTFTGTQYGIRLKTERGRGGWEQNFVYSNITMTNVTNPFYLVSYYPKTPTTPSSDTAQAVNSTTPAWKHITFKNITVTGSANAGTIWGLPEQSISDVVFDHVMISAPIGMKAYFVSGLVFKDGSTITTSGTALTTYQTTVSGINFTTGKPSYVVAATVSPANSGSIAGAGTFTNLQTVTLTATPSGGFIFSKWTEGNTDVSTNATVTFAADSDRVLVANFSTATGIDNIMDNNSVSVFPNPNNGAFTLQIDNEFMGEVTITVYSEIGAPLKIIKVNKLTQLFTKGIDIENLFQGTYFIKIQSTNYDTVKKVMIQ